MMFVKFHGVITKTLGEWMVVADEAYSSGRSDLGLHILKMIDKYGEDDDFGDLDISLNEEDILWIWELD